MVSQSNVQVIILEFPLNLSWKCLMKQEHTNVYKLYNDQEQSYVSVQHTNYWSLQTCGSTLRSSAPHKHSDEVEPGQVLR